MSKKILKAIALLEVVSDELGIIGPKISPETIKRQADKALELLHGAETELETTPEATEVEDILKEQKESIFQGLSFDSKPVSFHEYLSNYDDYVRRCSGI